MSNKFLIRNLPTVVAGKPKLLKFKPLIAYDLLLYTDIHLKSSKKESIKEMKKELFKLRNESEGTSFPVFPTLLFAKKNWTKIN